ncbi:hypothetical protein MBRA1_003219 [Malassezia brasiliensis]|uniref:Amidohydrolase-related domain-containing protein n=1 Tax=Malassezia brasiliensis TaxID=1821822 RepID=A0AAF0IU46_9BASI|nr:hypothetical protein MBRA1_003219 [Malassezia brasiliensis]
MSSVPTERLIDIDPEQGQGSSMAEDQHTFPEKEAPPLKRTNQKYDAPSSSKRFAGLPWWVWFLLATLFVANKINSVDDAIKRVVSNTSELRTGKQIRESDWEQCRLIRGRAGPPPKFHQRTKNDRFYTGTKPNLIRNATLWDGEDILYEMDILLDNGLISHVEKSGSSASARTHGTHVIEAHGRWVTPGIIDLHTHLGVMGMPMQPTTMDGNSFRGPTRPMVRSIDSFNEHDQDLHAAVGGGITSALVLPGSLDNIGGQAYPIKLGKLHGRPPSSRVLDPPRSMVMPGEREHGRDALYEASTGMHRKDHSTSFRQMKMACGENARKYGLVRMDEAWNFRREFERAQKLLRRQDDFCDALYDSGAPEEPSFPSELELDSLVDVLRGRTKVHTHCYTMNDLDAMVRHSTEFGFPIAAFHHAHETYLVPELLHKAYEHPPAVAMFSQNANYKYESYFGTPFAATLLRAANITPIFKSDHPVLDTRRLVHQAAEAHHYGLAEVDALKAVTSAPAHVLGLAHRIGHVKQGWDADLVLWDRHPLQLGATPRQVFIDGEAQLRNPTPSGEDVAHNEQQSTPRQPNYSVELARVEAMEPAIVEDRAFAFPTPDEAVDHAVLYNLYQFFHRRSDGHGMRIVAETFHDGKGVLVYANGSLVCVGRSDCMALAPKHARRVDLHNGTVIPGLIAYGATLGIADLPAESTANAGHDASDVNEHGELASRVTPRAVDELLWGGHDLLRAHSAGVTTAVNAPNVDGLVGGISAQFDTNVRNILDAFSVRASEVAMHIHLTHTGPSWASQIGVLRRALLHPPTEEWKRVAEGKLPLVAKANAQATIAQLVLLRKDFPRIHLVLDSTAPLHLLAEHLAAHHIGVLMPSKVWAYQWDGLDRLRGPPFTHDTEIGVLLKHGVRVGVRIEEAWEATKLLWETAWAAQEAHVTDPAKVLELLTTNVEALLRLPAAPGADFVAYDSNPFVYGAKVLAIGTPRAVELFL